MSDTLYNRLKKKFKVVIPNDWSNKQKGDFWEKVVAYLFRQQGWKVRENISITGMQIDVLIKNDVEEIGLVECKFHQEKIDADVIDKLIGKTNRKKPNFLIYYLHLNLIQLQTELFQSITIQSNLSNLDVGVENN